MLRKVSKKKLLQKKKKKTTKNNKRTPHRSQKQTKYSRQQNTPDFRRTDCRGGGSEDEFYLRQISNRLGEKFSSTARDDVKDVNKFLNKNPVKSTNIYIWGVDVQFNTKLYTTDHDFDLKHLAYQIEQKLIEWLNYRGKVETEIEKDTAGNDVISYWLNNDAFNFPTIVHRWNTRDTGYIYTMQDAIIYTNRELSKMKEKDLLETYFNQEPMTAQVAIPAQSQKDNTNVGVGLAERFAQHRKQR